MGVIVAREDRVEGGHLLRFTIDNAAKLNSLNRALAEEIVAAAAPLAEDADLRLVILTGAGERAFVGGADIGELAALDQTSAREFITLVHRCCDVFRRLPVPVIARIDGYALGAGLELARLDRQDGKEAEAETAFKDARRILRKAEDEEHRRERRV